MFVVAGLSMCAVAAIVCVLVKDGVGDAGEAATQEPEASVDSQAELRRLAEENRRLRGELDRVRAASARVEVGTDAAGADQSLSRGEATERGTSSADHETALQLLLAELREQIEAGWVSHYEGATAYLAHTATNTWLASGQSERAYRLFQELGARGMPRAAFSTYYLSDDQESDPDPLERIADGLLQQGDSVNATEAYFTIAQENGTNWHSVRRLMELDPQRAMEALDEYVARNADKPNVAASVEQQRALLAISAPVSPAERAAAWSTFDTIIAGDTVLDDAMNNMLIEHDPEGAVPRLEAQIKSSEAADHFVLYTHLRIKLAAALRASGDDVSAKSELLALVAEAPEYDYAIEALAEVDPEEAFRHLERRISHSPSPGIVEIYGDRLLAAGRRSEGLEAYKRALFLDKATDAAANHHWRNLLEAAPEQYASVVRDYILSRLPNRRDRMLAAVGDAYWRLGDSVEARRLWEMAFTFNGENDDVLTRLRAVRSGQNPLK